MALKWYVVHAYSNFEKKVKSSLEERIRLNGLEDKFGKILVPTEEVVEMKEGKEAQQRAQVLSGLCAGADGTGRGNLAPGQERAESPWIHRRAQRQA